MSVEDDKLRSPQGALGRPQALRYIAAEHNNGSPEGDPVEKIPEPHVSFFEVIGRPEIERVVTEKTPIINVSIEFGNDRKDSDSFGLKTGGGLGILNGDRVEEVADKFHYVALTLGYSRQWRQRLREDFWQEEVWKDVKPEDSRFSKVAETYVVTNGDRTKISGYVREKGKAKVVLAYEPGVGWLYQDNQNSQHRQYQSALLGFAGYNILKEMGYFPQDRVKQEPDFPDETFKKPEVYPAAVILDEAASAGFALAMFDDLCFNGCPEKEARAFLSKILSSANHTVEEAANPTYPAEWYKRYFFPSLRSKEAKQLLEWLINNEGGDRLNIGSIALYFAGKLNGVSKDHARILSETIKRPDGSKAEFTAITNGVHKRWFAQRMWDMYEEHGIYDEYDRPASNMEVRIDTLTPFEIEDNKRLSEEELRRYLQEERVDQFGRPVKTPERKNIIGIARRVAEYKQVDMLLDDPEGLKASLREGNFHLIIAGNVHPHDEGNGNGSGMKEKLKKVLEKIAADPELREVVTYVQDYDEELAKHLIAGARAWINIPKKGREACNTSVLKAVGNQTIVISIPDGVMLDNENGVYLRVEGQDREQQRDLLYERIRGVAKLLKRRDDPEKERRRILALGAFLKNQFKSYGRIVSSARMEEERINHVLPKAEFGGNGHRVGESVVYEKAVA